MVGFSALPFISVAPFFARLLLSVAAFLVKISDNFIVFLAGIPSLPLLNPAPLDLLLFYLLLMVLTIVPVNRHRHALCGCLAVVLLVHMTLLSEPQPRGLRMTFFSVGQGESTLITFSDGKRMLIDGGGSARQGGANVGERLLAPALWSMGVKKIDYMVLTHIHPDHLQGLLYIADNFRVGEFWRSRVSQDSDDFAKLMGILASRRIPVRLVDAATAPVTIARARFEFMSPSDGRIAGEDGAKLDANDDSLVFRLSYGRGEALFTGDIGFEAEQRLLDSKRRLSCDLLKVAHHGSRFSTSAAFLDAASPEIALISAGYGNSFHLPASETLSQLRERGVTVYRTDLDGTISVDYDPERGLFVVTKPDWHFN